ncbi:MAG: hypothetical protein R3305_06115 [Gammaproteobacteria bacterium]|nr:hypothetical protein [Gammaproteobacteria bacterium]
MYRRFLLLALATIAVNTAAARSFEMIEGAYEAALGDVTFPASTAGTLIVRLCGNCDPIAMPVSSSTVYKQGSATLPLAEFLNAVAEVRLEPNGNDRTAVSVFYSLDNNRVTRVVLHTQ